MPLEQRVIEPICVSRGCVPMDSSGNLAINIPNELECVTNGTLANIIRQLSSLSRYAEDLFGGILHDATLLIARATSLQGRIDRLGNKVISLDSSVEEVSLQDIHLRKAFKSSTVFDQQVVSRETIPVAIKDVYKECDKPPPLDKLNPYRDDGKDGLKFYTDPKYFFELWRQEMLADTEKVLADKVKKVPKNKPGSDGKKQRKVRQPANSRERYRQMMANQGEFIIDTKTNGPTSLQGQNLIYIDTNGSIVDPTNYNLMQSQARPNSLELRQVTYQQYIEMNGLAHNNHVNNHNNGLQHNHNSSNHLQYANQMMASQHGPQPNYYQQQYQQQQQLQHHKYQQEVIQQNHYNAQHVNYHSHQDQNIITGPQSQQQSTPTRRTGSITSRPSQPPPAPPSGPGSAPSSGPSTPSHTITRDRHNHESAGTPNHSKSIARETLPPPPPPPPTQQEINSNVMNGQQDPILVHNSKQSPVNHINNIPEQVKMEPPPPPPPPPSGVGAVVKDTTDGQQRASTQLPTIKDLQSIQLKKTPVNQTVAKSDARSDLLQAIREGIKLKRVEDCKQREVEKSTPLHDVASILARRVAIELSDSEGGADDDCDDDSDAWDDESEC